MNCKHHGPKTTCFVCKAKSDKRIEKKFRKTHGRRKLPIAQCEQLIRAYHMIESEIHSTLKRDVCLDRIRSVLKWGGSAWESRKAKPYRRREDFDHGQS